MVHSFFTESDKIKDLKGFKENAIWYDYVNLKEGERKELEKHLKLYIPTQEQMGKIGSSDRYFKKDENLYMTISVVAKARSDHPALFPISFILHPKFLMTVRYADPKPFQIFKHRLQETATEWKTPIDILLGLLETIVDRIAELVETIDLDIDTLSEEIFRTRTRKGSRTQELNEILTHLGKKGDLAAKINESSRSMQRLLHFFSLQKTGKEYEEGIKKTTVFQQDLISILDHLTFLSHKINFLLDASLGYITIEQNSIIKIFTIMAVVLLPPALVATIYGMNFSKMPELTWSYGYPFAILLMVLSAILPYLYFKRKGWF